MKLLLKELTGYSSNYRQKWPQLRRFATDSDRGKTHVAPAGAHSTVEPLSTPDQPIRKQPRQPPSTLHRPPHPQTPAAQTQ